MKYMLPLMVMAMVSPASAFNAYAADEFGARFSRTAPAALGAMPETMGPFSPADIEPAAGDEQSATDKIPAKIEYTSSDQASSPAMVGAAKPLITAPPQPLQ